mmetsp:Transcript_19527/g.40893  ORF Transcript_19527/g.40893 Transcript_19527/m.40893 type:complete len:297 (+) Transcript_19527:259-1149(+)
MVITPPHKLRPSFSAVKIGETGFSICCAFLYIQIHQDLYIHLSSLFASHNVGWNIVISSCCRCGRMIHHHPRMLLLIVDCNRRKAHTRPSWIVIRRRHWHSGLHILRIHHSSGITAHHHSTATADAHHARSTDNRCGTPCRAHPSRGHTHPSSNALSHNFAAHSPSCAIVQLSLNPLPLGHQSELVPHHALAVRQIVLVDVPCVLSGHASEVDPLHAVHKRSLAATARLADILLLALPAREAIKYSIPRLVRHLVAGGVSSGLVLTAVDPVAIVENPVVVLHLSLPVRTRVIVNLT